MEIYILTRVINAYDQDGEYFLAAFKELPTDKQLEEKLNLDLSNSSLGDHIRKGGGRIEFEHEWYFLHKIEI